MVIMITFLCSRTFKLHIFMIISEIYMEMQISKELELGTTSFQVPFQKRELELGTQFLFHPWNWNLERIPF